MPCVDGSWLARTFFTSQPWSVQPCVRPVSAVRMTAGHNALRGSGPGQKPAFDNALALVGCPDRRIDRLCITCCSPSQPSHHAGCPARSRSCRKCDGFFVAFALRHHGPSHSGDLVGECDGGDLGRPPRQQCRKPRSMLCAMDLGITDHGKCAGSEQAAQIATACAAGLSTRNADIETLTPTTESSAQSNRLLRLFTMMLRSSSITRCQDRRGALGNDFSQLLRTPLPQPHGVTSVAALNMTTGPNAGVTRSGFL